MSKLQEQERVTERESKSMGEGAKFTPLPSHAFAPSSPSQSTIQTRNSKLEMREPTTDLAVAYAIALLAHYKFELRGYTSEELVNLWLGKYPANWVRMAVIEALYQGRYKAVSVEQFLTVWMRRGQPIYHFNREFERLISRKLPQNLTAPLDLTAVDLMEEYDFPPLIPSADDTTEDEASFEDRLGSSTATATEDSSSMVPSTYAELTEKSLQPKSQPPEVRSKVSSRSTYDVDWSRCDLKKSPIHQFTPPPDASDFFLKLKAVAHTQDATAGTVSKSLRNDGE